MTGRAATFRRRLLSWYDANRRDLPWRSASGAHPDPYVVLVSEVMLQQTQVATVIPYFVRFVKEFPTVRHLAAADEQRVLRAWQGLGYYSRARNLRRAAQCIVQEFDGCVPADPTALRSLPGIGRYTAGAIASLAFGRRHPVLDGNVTRALCRLDMIKSDPRSRSTVEQLWRRAEALLPDDRVGDFNSALMELGATVCTPRNPNCADCPVRAHCMALAAGAVDRVPAPRRRPPTPVVRRTVTCLRNRGSYLLEQRPPAGRWAGLWQFPTTAASSAKGCGPRLGVIEHALTHRRYRFEVFHCQAASRLDHRPHRPHAWIRLSELSEYPLPKPHLLVAKMLESLGGADCPRVG
ncbi:MAG: A/G-specific adenine glycosylase [Tepidisphaeraceae bacterium]